METRKVKIVTVALLSAAVLMALSATVEAKNSVVKLENWQYNGIYDAGFSVEEFLDAGEILAVIIEPDVSIASTYDYYGYYATLFLRLRLRI